ncbi:DUF2202 domain-containing protein [Solwaraspora sp. WMMD792]|uniref:ferritin-like domain-containing protein n=1 Tax=Solwaraspora sp. WMMD792 TaxID=3016099 RepID=UPI0024167A3A|nr:DUF2202 domain-containing protein [Solwaraspora sp. WMMD792]MDG4773698.1 DUF2202 domain-containing protein [Solwaraspora sp. WMMD792]
MNRKTRLATALVAGGVLTAAAVAVTAPAIAGAGPFGNPSVSASWSGPMSHMGPGTAGNGMGRAGNGMGAASRDGSCLYPSADVPSGTLTEQQKATLASMAQEEKLAGDLYRAFADEYPAVVFDRIAAAEDQHLAAVRTLLDRYGLDDPTADQPAGQFSDPAVQATYDRLLAEGLTSQSAAFGVGQQVEQADIDSLQQALTGLSAGDVDRVYQHLLAASQRHLTAFTTWATR